MVSPIPKLAAMPERRFSDAVLARAAQAMPAAHTIPAAMPGSDYDTVRRILAKPTGGGTGAMKGQMILRPVTLVRAERLDGIARPTPGVKPWLIVVPGRGRTPG